jgi:hypothetical protein
MAVQIQLRNDTAANWTAANPVLAAGEMGVETDTDQFKLGNGVDSWTALTYGGLQGADGAPGADGADGVDGADGSFSSAQVVSNLSTNYTIQSSDKGKLFINSAAVTVTVQGLAIGEQVDFLQTNASQITFAAGAGTTLSSKASRFKTAAQGSPASVKCVATNTYWLLGDLGA